MTTAADSADVALRERLAAFYAAHNPAKADTVDAVLAQFAGRPAGHLVDALYVRYGPAALAVGARSEAALAAAAAAAASGDVDTAGDEDDDTDGDE